MKQTLLIFTALMLVFGCSSDKETDVKIDENTEEETSSSQASVEKEPEKDTFSSKAREPIDGSTLVYKDGLFCAPDSDKPYSGVAVEYYGNGQKESETGYKDGKLDGKVTTWLENGQKYIEGTYKNGKEDGLWTYWRENGQKWREVTYKDGQYISKKCWDDDGNESDNEGDCWDDKL